MKLIQYCIALLLFLPFMSQAQDLSKHHWKNRLVVVVADSASDELLNEQLEILSPEAEGLEDRKVLVYQVTPDATLIGDERVGEGEESKTLHHRFSPSGKNFQVLLIGLDGGVKYRQSKPISIEKLYGLIDRMPMRKLEIRQKSKN